MKVSIVTPSFEQAPFLEATLRSVLDEQTEPPDEYVVVDGGSSDGSREILERWGDRLTEWVSEPDGGQYAAIEKGFARTTGDVMAWLNSDDRYAPWALQLVRELFERFPQIEWLTTLYPLTMNERGGVVSCAYSGPAGRESFRRGGGLPWSRAGRGGIQQESTFWRRSLWERAGGRLESSLTYAADFELWLRFFDQAALFAVESPLGIFRVHPAQKSAASQAYLDEARHVLGTRGSRSSGEALRAGLVRLLGRRPLARLPRTPAQVLVTMGLLEPVPVVVWRGGEWRVERDYAI